MGQEQTAAEELKELQDKINLLSLQQSTQAKLTKTITTALKEQVDADILLEKTKAQLPFAKLETIKEGLEKFVPPGKEGKITVTQGTTGALLLKYKGAMLQAIDDAARIITERIQKQEQEGGVKIDTVVIGSNADFEAAYKSQLIENSIIDQVAALSHAIEKTPFMETAVVSELATAGLILKTITDFSKYFRTDSAISVFDAGEEANTLLELLFEAHMAQKKKVVIRLGDLGEDILKMARETINRLDFLKSEHHKAMQHLAHLENVVDEKKKNLPPQEAIDELRFQITATGELLEALNPLSNSEVFWMHVAGMTKHKRMRIKAVPDIAPSYHPRLVINARAQTVQVHETRVFREDRIYGRGEIQVDYRLSNSDGNLIFSGVLLKSIEANNQQEELTFPTS